MFLSLQTHQRWAPEATYQQQCVSTKKIPNNFLFRNIFLSSHGGPRDPYFFLFLDIPWGPRGSLGSQGGPGGEKTMKKRGEGVGAPEPLSYPGAPGMFHKILLQLQIGHLAEPPGTPGDPWGPWGAPWVALRCPLGPLGLCKVMLTYVDLF